MLSDNSSFIATNCLDLILLTSFAPIGGSADDRIMAPCCAEMGFGTNAGGRGLPTLLMRVAAAAADDAAGVPPGGNVVSPARADGGGMTSRGGPRKHRLLIKNGTG